MKKTSSSVQLRRWWLICDRSTVGGFNHSSPCSRLGKVNSAPLPGSSVATKGSNRRLHKSQAVIIAPLAIKAAVLDMDWASPIMTSHTHIDRKSASRAPTWAERLTRRARCHQSLASQGVAQLDWTGIQSLLPGARFGMRWDFARNIFGA